MRLIQEAADRGLVWRQPHGLKEAYELRAGEEVLATLRWPKLADSFAVAETADGSWTFTRTGFWRPEVTARAAGSASVVATFKPEGWGMAAR